MKNLKKMIIGGMLGLALLIGCGKETPRVCKSMDSAKIGKNSLTRMYFDYDCDGEVDFCKEIYGDRNSYENGTLKTIYYDIKNNVKTIYRTQSRKKSKIGLTAFEIEEINRRHNDNLYFERESFRQEYGLPQK